MTINILRYLQYFLIRTSEKRKIIYSPSIKYLSAI